MLRQMAIDVRLAGTYFSSPPPITNNEQPSMSHRFTRFKFHSLTQRQLWTETHPNTAYQ